MGIGILNILLFCGLAFPRDLWSVSIPYYKLSSASFFLIWVKSESHEVNIYVQKSHSLTPQELSSSPDLTSRRADAECNENEE
jgi:hypothetical protein